RCRRRDSCQAPAPRPSAPRSASPGRRSAPPRARRTPGPCSTTPGPSPPPRPAGALRGSARDRTGPRVASCPGRLGTGSERGERLAQLFVVRGGVVDLCGDAEDPAREGRPREDRELEAEALEEREMERVLLAVDAPRGKAL